MMKFKSTESINFVRSTFISSKLIILLLLLPLSAAAQTSKFDPIAVRSEMEALWNSLESFSYRSRAQFVRENGQPLPNAPIWEQEFTKAMGNCWRRSTTVIKANKREVINSFIEDGKFRYELRYMKEDPEWLSSIHITSQQNRPNSYNSGMDYILWLIMPSGKPPFEQLKPETVLNETSLNGERALKCDLKHKNMTMRLWILPDRDWLIGRVELIFSSGEKFVETEAARFAKHNGRWFPVEGLQIRHLENEVQRDRFQVVEFKINDHFDLKQFLPPKPPLGVTVYNSITDTSKINGGPDAEKRRFEEFLRAHPDVSSASQTIQSDSPGALPLIAEREPSSFPWALVIVIFSLIALAIVGAYKVRASLGRRS